MLAEMFRDCLPSLVVVAAGEGAFEAATPDSVLHLSYTSWTPFAARAVFNLLKIRI